MVEPDTLGLLVAEDILSETRRSDNQIRFLVRLCCVAQGDKG
jgi:hypothetical protein